jgi:hypothetical protein
MGSAGLWNQWGFRSPVPMAIDRFMKWSSSPKNENGRSWNSPQSRMPAARSRMPARVSVAARERGTAVSVLIGPGGC